MQATGNSGSRRFTHDTSVPSNDLGGPLIGIVFAGLALLAMLVA